MLLFSLNLYKVTLLQFLGVQFLIDPMLYQSYTKVTAFYLKISTKTTITIISSQYKLGRRRFSYIPFL